MVEAATESIFRQKPLQKWLLTGLLIRLLVMPFTTHSDLLSIYHRAHLLLDGKAINGLGPNLFNIIHAGFLWLMRPLLPYSTMWGNPKLNTYLALDWLGFVNTATVFRQLFLFKLPYLVFEVLAVWMLLKVVDSGRTERVLAFWVLNPVVIFSTYVFGRFDIIIVFLLLSALYAAKEGRNNRALIILGLAALLRVYPVILVLPFALTLEAQSRGRMRLAAIGFAPFFVSIFAGLAQGEGGPLKGFVAMQHLAYPLTMKFFLYAQDNIYVFVFLYSLIVMYLYVNQRIGFYHLKRYCLYVFLLFFATSFFHPHYFIWLAPFIAFYLDEPHFVPLHRLQIGGWVVYTFQWGRTLAFYLVASLSPAFFWAMISPSEWIEKYYPAAQFIGIGRSLFSATCLAMAYLVWRSRPDGNAAAALIEDRVKKLVA